MKYVLWIFALTLFGSAAAQTKYTIRGTVRDKQSGETLIGANIFNKANSADGSITNNFGFYSLTLPEGTYTLTFSHLGYLTFEAEIYLHKDMVYHVDLVSGIEMEEVVISASQVDKDQNIHSSEMGRTDLTIESLKGLPFLMGEVDVMKALQLMPGVMNPGEGNSGFYVRGGGPDQNLIMLDDAVLYNPGHLMGFFSVFNADALKRTTLIKGDMPARYGGRLSSVVDVQMKEGNERFYQVNGGIGLAASRIMAEGPLVKDKSSFLVSARRTYIFDIAQPFLKDTEAAGTNYYFYDFNVKTNYRISDKDRIYLSGYMGRDVLTFRNTTRDLNLDLPYGNRAATFRWNHLFSDKVFLNTSVVYNDYDFAFNGGQSDFNLGVSSGIRDWTFKSDLEFFPSTRHHITLGTQFIFHRLTPNITQIASGDVLLRNSNETHFAREAAFYVQDEYKLDNRFSMHLGARLPTFTQLGPYVSKINGKQYLFKEPVTTFAGFEPRIGWKYAYLKNASVKSSFTVANQYLHLVSNSTTTLPADIWVASTEWVRPQIGLQFALGFYQNFLDNTLETYVEFYGKRLLNQIDYREDYVEDFSRDIESEFVFGSGLAYGAEFFVRKRYGDLTGWIGYTLARSTRKFPDISEGKSYPIVYDRTHDLSVVLNYKINDYWDIAGTYVYGTGNTYTPIESVFLAGQNFHVNYGPRNSARLEPYHRIDFSLSFRPPIQVEKQFYSFWVLSVYNAYNRQNPFYRYYTLRTDPNTGSAIARGFKVSLFPVIPSITWNFQWRSEPG